MEETKEYYKEEIKKLIDEMDISKLRYYYTYILEYEKE